MQTQRETAAQAERQRVRHLQDKYECKMRVNGVMNDTLRVTWGTVALILRE